MQQDGNRSCWFPFIALIIPGGFFYYLPHPHPNPLSLSFSPVTSLIFSVLTIRSRGFRVEHRVHFDCVVHLCNEIKPSPFLPDLIRRTWRLIWKSVSSPHSWFFFKTNITLCVFLSSDLHWHAPTVWNRATPLTLFSASHSPFLFAKPGEHNCF